MKKQLLYLLLAGTVAFGLCSTRLQADTAYYFTGATSGDGADVANWTTDSAGTTPATTAPGSDSGSLDTLVFNSASVTNPFSGFNASRYYIADYNFTSNYVSSTINGSIVLNLCGRSDGSGGITVDSGAQAVTIDDYILGSSATSNDFLLTNNSSYDVTFNERITNYGQTHGVTVVGTGLYVFNGTSNSTDTFLGGCNFGFGTRTFNVGTDDTAGNLQLNGTYFIRSQNSEDIKSIAINNGTFTLTEGTGAGRFDLMYNAHMIIGNNSVSGAATFNQTGGTFRASTYLNGHDQSVHIGYTSAGEMNVSGGTFTLIGANANTNEHPFLVGICGDGTATISGTADVAVPNVQFNRFDDSVGTTDGNGTVNLDGGTLSTAYIARNTAGNGTATFNFNGGTLIATASTATFMEGLTAANVKAGGAAFNTNGNDITVAQALVTGVTGSDDGGLTKTGAGALALSGANTYTGQTAVQQGSLVLGLNAHNPVFNNGGADVRAAAKLVFDYAGGSTPVTTVRDSLFSGKIVSTDTTASHGLGYADDGSSQVRVEYTYFGDSDLDGDVDNSDFLSVYGNFTGPGGGTTEIWGTGDFDYDGDVDNSDFLSVYGNFTGPLTTGMMSALSANIDIADLIYDPATGNVKLDASEAAGGVITGFVLQNAVGGDDFITGVVDFPYLVGSETDLATEISDVDLTKVGFSGVYDLGNIFVTGLDAASLSAYLTKANYVGSYGSGEFSFDLTVVPEPSTLALLACGMFALLAYVWRKRR